MSRRPRSRSVVLRSGLRAAIAAAMVGFLVLVGLTPAHADEGSPGSIRGTVTALGGGPLEQGVQVYAYTPGGNPLPSVSTFVDAQGSYTIDDLPVGDYIVYFVPVPDLSTPYLDQYWNGVYRESEATPVSITAQRPAIDGIDAVMAVGATVSTALTIAGTGDPATGVSTTLYRVEPGGGLTQVETQTSVADYPVETTNLPPGEYTIFADASTRTESPALRSQWLGGSTTREGAETFTVGLGETVRNEIKLKLVDPVAALPCVDPRDRAAMREVVAQYVAFGGTLRGLTRADLAAYVARCR